MIRGVHTTIQRELKRIWQFKPYFATLTILPLSSLLLFAAIFYKGIPHDLPIAIVDGDHSVLSRRLTTMIDATPEVTVRFEIPDTYEGERLIRRGEVGAMVIIPHNFEKYILSLTQTPVEAYISGTNILENGLISKALQASIATFSVGIQMQTLLQQGLSESQALAQAMPIRFDKRVLFNPYTNYSYYLSPSFMPMMILIFTMLSTIFAIGSELRYSTAGEWILSANGSIATALIGKLTPTFIAMTSMAMIMFILLFEVIGVPLRGSVWLLITSCEIFIITYMGIAVFIVAITADMRLAMSLGGGYSVMAFSLSGLTFPTMAMHKGMQWFSHLFPFTYFTDIMVDQALRGAPIGYSITQLSYMMIFLVLPITVIPRLKKITRNQEFWGKI